MYIMMGILTRSLMGMLAGMMVGSVILGYCLYFDHQRTKDPQYKRKLREKRLKNSADAGFKFPNRNDLEYLQNEMKLGEEDLGRGDINRGLAHVANAIIYSEFPQKLLKILQQTLPPHIFHMLLQELRMRRELQPDKYEWLLDFK